MASGSEASCANDPNFAIICSFFEKFSSMLNIQQPDMLMLQMWLENSDEVASGLRDLHIKLLRKMRKTVHETAWETALAKFCYQYSAQDAWEIERFGYKKSSLKVKLRILTAILEYQFQYNGKFRNKFSILSAEELRSEPIGRDRLGHSYWLTQDPSCNFRIYQEHLDEEIWQVVASNRSEMETLIRRLKGNEVVLPSLVGVVDEDSSSNSCANAVIKPPPPEEQDDSQSSSIGSNSKAKIPNIKIKIESRSLVEKNGDMTNGKGDEDQDEESKHAMGEEGNENDEESAEDVGSEAEETDEGEREKDEENQMSDAPATTTAVQENDDVQSELENGDSAAHDGIVANGKSANPRKIKLLAINQSKLTTASEDKTNTKKRLFKDTTNGELETEQPDLKKSRPTLSDNRRDKKSKYEKLSEDEDDEDEDETEEEEDENDEDFDDPGDNEKDEPDDEEATEMEDAKRANGIDEDTENGCVNNVVGEAIEENVLIVKGEGSGKDCETPSSSTCFLRSISIGGCEDGAENYVGEAIEEEVMYIYGEGTGRCCLVGNTHEEKCETDTILLKHSKSIQIEVKTKQVEKEIAKSDENKNEESSTTVAMTNGEINVGKMQKSNDAAAANQEESVEIKEQEDADVNCSAGGSDAESKSPSKASSEENSKAENNSEPHNPTNNDHTNNVKDSKEEEKACVGDVASPNNLKEPLSDSEKHDKEPPSAEKLLDHAVVELPPPAGLKDANHITPPQNVISEKRNSKSPSPANDLKSETDLSEVQENLSNTEEVSKHSKESADAISIETVELQTQNEVKTPILPDLFSAGNSRKRRLSEEKTTYDFSDSESDLNSDSAAPPTDEEEEDVGGKRPKMRMKIVKSADMRKKIEKLRKSNEGPKSTSEDESLPCTAQESSTVDNGSVDETDPLHISDKDDGLAAKAAELESMEVPTKPILIHTRSTRRTSTTGTISKTAATLSGRGRKKPGKQRYTRKVQRIPSLKLETAMGEDTRSDDDHGSDKMPLLEPAESTVQQGASLSKDAPSQRKPRGRKRDIDTSNIIDSQTETPVRQSRRIAQLKIREEAERRKLEEEALKKMKAEFKKKKKQEETSAKGEITAAVAPTESSEHTAEESEAEEGKKFAPKKKGGGARGWKKSGWSSGPDEPEEDDEYDLHHDRYESERGSPLFKSDHEFSPESDIEDESQAVPLKRARTVRKEGAEDDGSSVNFDESCQKCGKSDHPEWILLCDKCDKGYHCSCLSPVLFIIPEGDWFCPPCQQEQLIVSLENQLIVLDDRVEQKLVREAEAKRMEIERKLKEEEEQAKDKEHSSEHVEETTSASRRPKKNRAERAHRRRRPKFRKSFIADDDEESEDDFEDDSRSSASRSSNDSDSGSKSSSDASDSEDNEPIYKLRKRRQVNVSYRLNEYEDLINSAIKEEMDEVAGAGNLGRGKDISTIIEADKEEKLRQKQMCSYSEPEELHDQKAEVKEEVENGEATKPVATESEDEEIIAPVKCRTKHSSKHAKKKGRKLNNLDISSDDDGSDEDFKTSSYETEEDESISVSTDSDSSLEVYRKRGKKGRKKDKKGKRPQRRAARERRRLDDFIVDDSDWSDDDLPKPRRRVKQKQNWELQDTESEEDLSEQVDSEELCEDTTDSEDSDGCWRPSKRRRMKGKSKVLNPQASNPLGARGGKQPRKFNRNDSGERLFKAKSKKKSRRETDDSDEDVPRTRGKRFTYLDSFDEESSDDGIKPGVKRPDTPPEEREKFIKKQEEIKRMLAEKNTEAAKAVATPTLAPVDSLSTVPLSVIKGAKALDIDYLQRKGELNSEEGDTDFDEDLPDDFDPEAMDEEEIAKMMEEEDFAQQQLKLTGDTTVRQKRKDIETLQASDLRQHTGAMLQVGKEPPVSLLQEPPRKRLPMPTIHPPLSGMPRFLPPGGRSLYDPSARHHLSVPMSMQSVIQGRTMVPALGTMSGAPPQSLLSNANVSGSSALLAQSAANDQMKPRGRRKKITPLRDTLQKQQAAAAAAAAATVTSIPSAGQGVVGPGVASAKELQAIAAEKPTAGVPVVGPLQLSVAQPPQLYAPPTSTPPSVITRMPQQLTAVTRAQQPLHPQQPPHRSLRPPFPEQNSRYYSAPNQIAQHHRMSIIRHGGPPMPHHAMGPSFAAGPPPLRSGNPRIPASVGNVVNRQSSPRPPLTAFTHNEQFAGQRGPHPNPPHAYRPPLYGTPGYPPAPPQQPQTPMHPTAPDYHPSVPASYGPTPPYGSPFYPPPPQNIVPSHSTPAPPAATAVPVSSPVPMPTLPAPAVAPIPSAAIPPPTIVTEPPTTPPHTIAVPVGPVVESTILIAQAQQPPRSQASILETFDSKSRSPILESEVNHSPYSNSGNPDENDEESSSGVRPSSNSTSEFSGLVSYFSSQHDDLNS